MPLLFQLVRYEDSEGREHFLEVRGDIAVILAETETPLKERLLRVPDAIESVADRSFEGHRLKFRLFLGESRSWFGEPRFELEGELYCSICLGAKLPDYAYCLGCDACGREIEIKKPGDVK